MRLRALRAYVPLNFPWLRAFVPEYLKQRAYMASSFYLPTCVNNLNYVPTCPQFIYAFLPKKP